MTQQVTATFKTRAAAQAAVDSLIEAGFYEEDISLLVTDTTRGSSFAIKEGDKSESYEAVGAEAGSILLAVAADDDDEEKLAKRILKEANAIKVAA